MTRCTAKTLQGKRCKKHSSHDGKCLLHTGIVFSEVSTETTVEVEVPLINDYVDEIYDAFAVILSRFSENEIKYITDKAIER